MTGNGKAKGKGMEEEWKRREEMRKGTGKGGKNKGLASHPIPYNM